MRELLLAFFFLAFLSSISSERCGNGDLRNAINAALNELLQDPEWTSIQEQYPFLVPASTPPILDATTCPSTSNTSFPYPEKEKIVVEGTFDKILKEQIVHIGGQPGQPPYSNLAPLVGTPEVSNLHYLFDFQGVEVDILNHVFQRIADHYETTIDTQYEVINWCHPGLNNEFGGYGPIGGFPGCLPTFPSAFSFLVASVYDVGFGGIERSENRSQVIGYTCPWRLYPGDTIYYNSKSFNNPAYPSSFNDPSVNICFSKGSMVHLSQTPSATITAFDTDFRSIQDLIQGGGCDAVQGDVSTFSTLVSQLDTEKVLRQPSGLSSGVIPDTNLGGLHFVVPPDPSDCPSSFLTFSLVNSFLIVLFYILVQDF